MPVVVANFIRNPHAGGKFVILRSRMKGEGKGEGEGGGDEDEDDGVVLFSDFTRDSQHVDLVRRWETGNKTTLAAAGLKPCGGGWWKYETPSLLVLYGRSAAFGRFDAAWLRDCLTPGMVGAETRLEVR